MIDLEHVPVKFLIQRYLKLAVSLYLVSIFVQLEKFNRHNAHRIIHDKHIES